MSVKINGLSSGFLSALALFGIGNPKSEASTLPDISKLKFVNCAYYTGDIGEGVCNLSDSTYYTVFSSRFDYIPKKGGIVMMGSYQLVDLEYYGDIVPRAMMRITADDKKIFEGEVADYFPDTTDKEESEGEVGYYPDISVKEVRAFSYEKSFKIEAKRLNLSDNMSLALYQTMIIGYD